MSTKEKLKADVVLGGEVKVEWDVDVDPDLSFLGEYAGKEGEGTLERASHGCKVGDHECRYFKPANHWPHNPKNWDHVSGAEKAGVIKKHGSLRNADLHYAIKAMRRMEDYNDQKWYMVYCKVTVTLGGLSAFDSVCGVESDSSEDHRKEIERNCLSEALAELKEKAMKRLEVE